MNELIHNARSQLHELCRKHNVRKLDLFGSATSDRFNPAISDLDFVVEFGEFKKGEYATHYFELLEELQSLFERRVDLVVERAISNPIMLESVAKTRQPIYAA